jgi:hypothetical protein
MQLQANFVENIKTCRHVQVCRYFGERIDLKKEGMLEKLCNGMCDVSFFGRWHRVPRRADTRIGLRQPRSGPPAIHTRQ